VKKLPKPTCIKMIIVLGIVSYSLQYTWEEFQCEPFFNHPSARWMAADMFGAAIVDVATTYIIYTIIALVSKSWLWFLGKWNRMQWPLILGLGLVASISFELLSQASNSWGYTELAPLIPGLEISLIPVLQFLLLIPLSFYVTRYIIR
jgi:hypothetical protein